MSNTKDHPPCEVTPNGNALWRELVTRCPTLAYMEWDCRITIEKALKENKQ